MDLTHSVLARDNPRARVKYELGLRPSASEPSEFIIINLIIANGILNCNYFRRPDNKHRRYCCAKKVGSSN